MGVSSYLIPIAVLLSLKFSPVQSQQFASDFCANNFAIYENKIIRTEDSKKLGAKYLTSKDLTSRRECLKLCCLTNMCDVFIFEEKVKCRSSLFLLTEILIYICTYMLLCNVCSFSNTQMIEKAQGDCTMYISLLFTVKLDTHQLLKNQIHVLHNILKPVLLSVSVTKLPNAS